MCSSIRLYVIIYTMAADTIVLLRLGQALIIVIIIHSAS